MSSLPKLKILWRHWDIVEKKIKEEMIWLRNDINTFSDKKRKRMRRFIYLVVPDDDKLIEFTRV